MTPEAVAKLARECARAVAKVEGPSSYYERLLPVLTAHLSAQEEGYTRLREAAAYKPPAADSIVTPMLAGWVVTLWCDGGRDWHGKAVWNRHHAADTVLKVEGNCLAQCFTRLGNLVDRHCRNQEFSAITP